MLSIQLISLYRMDRQSTRFLPRLILKSDWNKVVAMKETLDRIDEFINEDKESSSHSINLSPSSSNDASPITRPSLRPSIPIKIGWSSDSPPPSSLPHQFSTLHRPSHHREHNSARLSYQEPSPFFSYPMQMQPTIMHPQQSQQQVLQYPLHSQMIPSMVSSSQPSFHPHISYNQSMVQHSTEPQMWHPSSVPPSYSLSPPQVLYFSPYTNPPSAFLPSKHDTYSEEDYDPFPSSFSSICCNSVTQLCWILIILLISIVIGAFFLGLFSL